MSTFAFSAEHGTLQLFTFATGRLSRLGHDLVIEVREWEATVEVDDGDVRSVGLSAQLSSIEVLRGENGVLPLTPVDRRSIRRNALKILRVDATPLVTFTSTGVHDVVGGVDARGTLTVAGAAHETVVPVRRVAGRAQADVDVRHGDHTLQPYTAALGGLKVEDVVRVRLSVDLPPSLDT